LSLQLHNEYKAVLDVDYKPVKNVFVGIAQFESQEALDKANEDLVESDEGKEFLKTFTQQCDVIVLVGTKRNCYFLTNTITFITR
jgi:hypothetical protein